MKRRVRSAVLVSLLAAAAVAVAAAEDCANTSTRQSPVGEIGLSAYADPETGELVAPDAVEVLGATGSGGSGSKQVPVIVPAPTEAGGVMVDLRGHFMHATRAHFAEGNLSADCLPARSPP